MGDYPLSHNPGSELHQNGHSRNCASKEFVVNAIILSWILAILAILAGWFIA